MPEKSGVVAGCAATGTALRTTANAIVNRSVQRLTVLAHRRSMAPLPVTFGMLNAAQDAAQKRSAQWQHRLPREAMMAAPRALPRAMSLGRRIARRRRCQKFP